MIATANKQNKPIMQKPTESVSDHTDSSIEVSVDQRDSQVEESYDAEAAKGYVSSHSRGAPRACRIASWIIGLVVLAAAAYAVYYFVDKSRAPGQHEDFQGSVSLLALEDHATPDDCWVAYHGSVYDMTAYANRHPAGPNWITPYCGTDGTEAYARYHPQRLLNTIPETLLGVYEEGTTFVDTGNNNNYSYSSSSD